MCAKRAGPSLGPPGSDPYLIVESALLTESVPHYTISVGRDMKNKSVELQPRNETLLRPREAALQLRIRFPTIKQWIYARKIRSVKTPGGTIPSRRARLIDFCSRPGRRRPQSARS
jgi:hypothetical protein